MALRTNQIFDEVNMMMETKLHPELNTFPWFLKYIYWALTNNQLS